MSHPSKTTFLTPTNEDLFRWQDSNDLEISDCEDLSNHGEGHEVWLDSGDGDDGLDDFDLHCDDQSHENDPLGDDFFTRDD
eukprot:CAMPEP_0115003092 /NCGR_PEP_ID=MMETSP0216-20121206/18391_1 /TAXON_ID=223996 /ORGANISM="Protocruzia adherens, Strain Boccale" /LENGTH=80 /DNA_ID=CAMNT_0002368803 /DNA_START=105 /DNA_END=347 /DNA_ORIENTATION=+